MSVQLVPGTAHRALAGGIAAALGTVPASCQVVRFPDGELRPVVEGVRGDDVYVVQPTGPPAGEHLVELLLLVDACRRAGAGRVTAVVPYFGYARQDRRQREGEAVGARVCADALGAGGVERLVVIDPHTAALEAMCDMPVETLTAVPVLAAGLEDALGPEAVVVAPDLGAVKLAERYAARSGRGVSVVRKARLSGDVVRASELVGDVAGRSVVIVDDMISTGATIEAAVGVVLAHGAAADVTVAATHGLFVGGALERIEASGARRVVVTDTLATPGEVAPAGSQSRLDVRTVAPLLADAIGRLHRNQTMEDLSPAS